MPVPLPPRPNFEWLRKTAKDRLSAMRETDPDACLADAQLAVARECGFPSWRALKVCVESWDLPSATEDRPFSDEARFLELVALGRMDDLRAMLDETPSLVNAVGPHPFWGGRPQPLHVAIERGRPEVIALLLDRGADVNGRSDEYDCWSPLMIAASRPDVAADLIRRGAHVGLGEALLLADDARLDTLLADGHLPGNVPNGGSWLAFARTPHAIDTLLALGAPVDQPDRWGTTPVDALSRQGPRAAALVDHLRERGTPSTPEALARIGDVPALETAANDDATILTRDSVMVAAVDASQIAMVEWLLARGASPRARTGPPSRHTALHAAAWNGNLQLVRLLVAAGADPHARDDEHDATPLGWAETAVKMTGKPGCDEVAAYLRSLEG